MAGETPMGDWSSALQKAQADLMRQWLDMNAAWARTTWKAPIRPSAAVIRASASVVSWTGSALPARTDAESSNLPGASRKTEAVNRTPRDTL